MISNDNVAKVMNRNKKTFRVFETLKVYGNYRNKKGES
jgi:hypothetical protein